MTSEQIEKEIENFEAWFKENAQVGESGLCYCFAKNEAQAAWLERAKQSQQPMPLND